MFVVSDKIWAYKQNLKLCNACFCHCERVSLPVIKNISDLIDGDINEHFILF